MSVTISYLNDKYQNALRAKLYQNHHRKSLQQLTFATSTQKSVDKNTLEDIEQRVKHVNELQSKESYYKWIIKQKVDMDKIKPKIVETFSEIDFVKQICYENDVNDDQIKLLLIYEHDNYAYSTNIIFDRLLKLEDQFPDVYITLLTLQSSEVGPNKLDGTTTIFKRK